MQREASAATRNPPVAVFGRCERCHGKTEWGLETIGPCANVELQFSLVPQAHQKRKDRTCSIPVRMKFEWPDNLKQIVMMCFVLEWAWELGGSPTLIHVILGVFDPLVRRGPFRF